MKALTRCAFIFSILINALLCSQDSTVYYSDFETIQDFSSLPEWSSTDDSASVTSVSSYQSDQSVLIPPATPENIASLFLSLPDATSVLFVDYYTQAAASPLPALLSLTDPVTTALVAIQPYAPNLGGWAFLDGAGNGGGTWLSTWKTVPLDDFNRTIGWHRVTLGLYLESNFYDVYIDGQLVAADLGFLENLLDDLEAINIYGNTTHSTYLDNFSLTTENPLLPDADSDGMEDSFEALYGINDRGSDPDSDGLTNIEEYMYGTNPLESNIFNVTLIPESQPTIINEVNGNLEIINAGEKLFSKPLHEIHGLNIVGAANTGGIDISYNGIIHGFLSMEGDLGTVTFDGALLVSGDLSILGADAVFLNESVTVKGTTKIDASNGVYVNALFSSRKDVELVTDTDLIVSNGSISIVNGRLDVTVGRDCFIQNNSQVSVAGGSMIFDVSGEILLNNGSQITADNSFTGFESAELRVGGAITVSNDSLIETNNNYMVLIAQGPIRLENNSVNHGVTATGGYVIIQTHSDCILESSSMFLDSILFMHVGNSLSVTHSTIKVDSRVAQLVVYSEVTLQEYSRLSVENGSLYFHVNNDLAIINNSTIKVAKGNIGLNVAGSARVEGKSSLEIDNSLTTSDKSLQLTVEGTTKFDGESALVVNNAKLNTFFYGDINLSNSSLEVFDGDASIHAHANLTFTNSARVINRGNLSVDVAQSIQVKNSNITVDSGNLNLTTKDLIMDSASELGIMSGNLHSDVFGNATLGGAINTDGLFSMSTQGRFTLTGTGSLETLTSRLTSGEDIFIDGLMNADQKSIEVSLLAAGRIHMENDAPITSQQLSATSNNGILLNTEVDLLTVQTLEDLNNLDNHADSVAIDVYEKDDVIVNKAYNADGPIRLIAGGTIMANQVDSATDAPGRDVELMSINGDIEVGLLSTGKTHGKLLLSAKGDLKEMLNYDAEYDIIGNEAKIYIDGSIASGDAAPEIDVVSQINEPLTYAIMFDLGSYGTRTGGGALTQTVNNGGAADAPTFDTDPNWSFIQWDTEFYNITSDLTIKAHYVQIADNDLLPDQWEFETFGNLNQTEWDDPDADGFNNLDEYRFATNPLSDSADADSDDIPDHLEMSWFGSLAENPLDDFDQDGIPNIFEAYHGSDPSDIHSIPTSESTLAYFKADASLNEAIGNIYPTIQDAVVAASGVKHAIIELLPGDYIESVTLSSSLLIIAQDPEQTTLRSTSLAEKALTLSGSEDCFLNGLSILYDQGNAAPVEINSSGQTTIKNCTIKAQGSDLTFTHGGGITSTGGIVYLESCLMPVAAQ